MHFKPSILVLVALPLMASADILRRFQCTCSSNGRVGYHLEYQYEAVRVPNQVFVAQDDCLGPTGGCNQDITFLQSFDTTVNGHTFKYHRNLFGSDDYEFDNSGELDVPTDQARTMGGAREYCTSVCKSLNGELEVDVLCSDPGKDEACKTQEFSVPNI